MQYVGAALKLQPGDLARVAATIGVTEAHIRTMIEVETSGKGFDASNRPTFLFEPHIFYRNVPANKKAEAIKKGLAYPAWKGPGSYPKTLALRWAQYLQAAALDETAALKSASWGLGQIMGSEYDEAGSASPQEMVTKFCHSELEQIQGMANLLKRRGLDVALRAFPNMDACRKVALRYNGKAYEKNKYHTKLHDAYVRWAARLKQEGTTEAPDDGILRMGDSGSAVKSMQQLFKDKGYSLLVDGKFGSGTRTTILAWKANEGLPLMPEMSPNDIKALEASGQMPIPEERANATAEDLKPTSKIIQDTSTLKQGAGWGLTGLGLFKGADESGLLDQAQSYTDKAQQAEGIFSTVRSLLVDSGVADFMHLVLAYKFEILLVGVIVGFFIINRIQKNRVEMHKKAEIA